MVYDSVQTNQSPITLYGLWNQGFEFAPNFLQITYYAVMNVTVEEPLSVCAPAFQLGNKSFVVSGFPYSPVIGDLFINTSSTSFSHSAPGTPFSSLFIPTFLSVVENKNAVNIVNVGSGPLSNVNCLIKYNASQIAYSSDPICSSPSNFTCGSYLNENYLASTSFLRPGESFRIGMAEDSLKLGPISSTIPGVTPFFWNIQCDASTTMPVFGASPRTLTTPFVTHPVATFPDHSFCCPTVTYPSMWNVVRPGDTVQVHLKVTLMPASTLDFLLNLHGFNASIFEVSQVSYNFESPAMSTGDAEVIDATSGGIYFASIKVPAPTILNVTFTLQTKLVGVPFGTLTLTHDGITSQSKNLTALYPSLVPGDCQSFSADQCGQCLPLSHPMYDVCISGCDKAPFSTLGRDSCGICRTTNRDVCDSTGCVDGEFRDRCDRCLLPTSPKWDSCVGCDDVPYSGFYRLWCDVCVDPENPTSCPDLYCDGNYNSGYFVDSCGKCVPPGSPASPTSCEQPRNTDISVQPVILCWDDVLSNGTVPRFVAFASYINEGPEISIPIGNQNRFFRKINRNQPILFRGNGNSPRYGQSGVFAFEWGGAPERWTVGGLVHFFIPFQLRLLELCILMSLLSSFFTGGFDRSCQSFLRL